MTVKIFPHTLNLYQKPKVGNNYLDRFRLYNYKHRIQSVGGFDSASCDIVPRSKATPEKFIDQFLGNRVAIFVDNPASPVWEGFINRLTFSVGGSALTISLDEMMNQVSVKVMPFGGTLTTTDATATVSSLASQAVYGIKAGTLDLGFFRITGTTRAATLADTKLAQLAWPKQSVTDKSGVQPGVIHLEMLGFYHTLRWEERNQISSSSATLTNMIIGATGVLQNLQNGTTFFDNADYTAIATNTVTMPIDEYRGKTMWDTLVEIQETGDTNKNYYTIGITPTDFQTGKRHLYYRVANATIDYTARLRDGLRPRDLDGRVLAPWLVRPDHGIRISDWLIGGAISGDDPRETYIMNVDYDANSLKVVWAGDDQLNGEAAFQLHRNTKSFGKRFGSPPFRAATS